MASTWKRGRDGIKLPAEEWAKYGYSPRRRAMAYVLADCLIKGNIVGAQRVDGKRVGGRPGPYRLRYQEEKRRVFHKHPEWNWTDCTTCDGAGADAEREMCSTCSGTGKKSMHAHLHSSLLCSKLFLRELWNVWHGKSHAVHGWKG